MKQTTDPESEAVARLIAEIDELDRARDRVGRRVVMAFLGTFAAALGLLVYVALYDAPPRPVQKNPGPKVPGVLQPAVPR